MKYYIYLDTKIIGAFKQTVHYFNSQVFDKNQVIVIWKKYNKIRRKAEHIFKTNHINNIGYKRFSQLPELEHNSIIFYLFNAQSNCRLVANRNVKHVFVTHGESNKVASTKPIIRIYDHVVVAGDIGIDRYLQNGLFYKEDIQRKRIIKFGNTFIGVSCYERDLKSKSILYAPTWEGGIKEENYSSINDDLLSFKLIGEYASKAAIRKIYIQPHPNTGHRNKKYLLNLLRGINYLKKSGYKIDIVNFDFNPVTFFLKYIGANIIKSVDIDIPISKAFVDISAMEVQLIDKDIPTHVFFTSTQNSIPKNSLLQRHYAKCGIFDYVLENYDYDGIDKSIKRYFISYENDKIENSPLYNRIELIKEVISNNGSL